MLIFTVWNIIHEELKHHRNQKEKFQEYQSPKPKFTIVFIRVEHNYPKILIRRVRTKYYVKEAPNCPEFTFVIYDKIQGVTFCRIALFFIRTTRIWIVIFLEHFVFFLSVGHIWNINIHNADIFWQYHSLVLLVLF